MNELASLSRGMQETTGMTVAIWVGEDADLNEAAALLHRTLDDVELFVRPRNVVLVIDGCPHIRGPTEDVCDAVEERCGNRPRIEENEENEGQGGAVASGIELLLAETEVNYICTRDMDADHDIYDVPQLYRKLRKVQDHEGSDKAFVVGERADLHRPMGYGRGELEAMLNEVTIQGLTATGCVPQLKHCRMYRHYPDFQSGFKMYTRPAARAAAEALRGLDDRRPDLEPLKWGVQFISTVELLLQKAVPASIQRLTFDEQPRTTFVGHGNFAQAYGRQVAWLFQRLQLKPETGWAILDNSLARTMLVTVAGGYETIVELREYVAEHTWGSEAPPAPPRGWMF